MKEIWVRVYEGEYVWGEGGDMCTVYVGVCVFMGSVILHPLVIEQESSPDFARELYLKEIPSKWNTEQTKLQKI